ncbi:MAG: hypothetical protein Q7R48_01415 [bacterium]|nr:hypothetical protein [bacterium]
MAGGIKLSVRILLYKRGFVMFFEIALLLLNGLAWVAVLGVQIQSAKATKERLSHIIEGQRLSAILRIEPSKLEIDPARFEADKEKLKTRAINALHSERHPQPETQAFLVLKASGLYEFLDGMTALSLQKALARLIVNEDRETAEALLGEVIDQL